MSAHSASPWRHNHLSGEIFSHQGVAVCQVPFEEADEWDNAPGRAMLRANIALIESAPEMLNALRVVRAYVVRLAQTGVTGADDARKALDFAIGKARGVR